MQRGENLVIHGITAKGVELDTAIKFCTQVIKEYGGIVRDNVRVEAKPYYSMTRFWFRFKLPHLKYRSGYDVKLEIEAVVKSHHKILKEASVV